MAADRAGAPLDFAALFRAVPAACVVLDRELRIVALNDAYARATGRTAGELTGRGFFDAFPPEPGAPEPSGAEVHRRSLETVLATGLPDVLVLLRFAIPGKAGEQLEPRWWNVVNEPLADSSGKVELIIHRIDDVTEFVRAEQQQDKAPGSDGRAAPGLRSQVYMRVRELQEAHARLEESAAWTSGVALALQRTMLSAPDLEAHPEIAVRYRPALQGMNACGDWYDVVDLHDGQLGLTVGDVVGHGVAAASVMGMLRSALSAAIRVADSPSGALETLGLYARSLEGAMATTTFACRIFPVSRLLTYSNAGHPPPVLMHPDGTYELLDRATDPPLGARPEHVPRPQASTDFRTGDTLVLYTDGLIERRAEDIDVGLARLVDAVRELRGQPPEQLADSLLRAMADPTGQHDDISLLIARL
ncbi:SpoIIE family protein phosphatase [Streptacidiphilus sp. PB12-B1b]|uniref:PP2C family protein-serine/threonine phosphatase n=1 Tax=Streptacidiphilus sp. PB12-B1b TaxID=2705012 RepID=UPI0015F78953|nr:SpoIIE family protein phosphatase [Streptacidiphilus sp. PB12-B1b]QMU77178.1 SpoIIE family protein phosphatase [Streptacidiphilus sp. PB12-B1b]